MKILYLFLLIILLAHPAFAGYNRYDSFVDLNQITWFDRGLYENTIKYQPCVDLNEFYAYADSDPFDGFDREGIERYTDRLGYEDYETFSNANRFDRYNKNDFRKREDFHCSLPQEYEEFSNRNRFDQYEPDDYYKFWGYEDLSDWRDHERHNGYRKDNHFISGSYWREDGFGGIASWFRG